MNKQVTVPYFKVLCRSLHEEIENTKTSLMILGPVAKIQTKSILNRRQVLTVHHK